MKYTADTITDSDIKRLRDIKSWSSHWQRCFAIALREVHAVNSPDETRADCRARIAEILNSRATKEKP